MRDQAEPFSLVLEQSQADQLLQLKVPALAPLDPAQCMLEMSGMLVFGMPKLVWSGLSTIVPTP